MHWQLASRCNFPDFKHKKIIVETQSEEVSGNRRCCEKARDILNKIYISAEPYLTTQTWGMEVISKGVTSMAAVAAAAASAAKVADVGSLA